MNIALLRAVNLPGHQTVLMADLRALFEKLGFEEVKTIVASGNIVFRGKTTEEFLEREAKKRFGFGTDFFLRTADEWASIVERNPFDDTSRLVVAVLKNAAGSIEWPGPEIVRVDGRHAYIVYPNGQGRSKLTNAVLEKKLGTRCTARNWNTVMKLHAITARTSS